MAKEQTPQEEGRSFEQRFADRFGVSPQPGSGNQWYAKLDVGDRKILWSLKFTKKKSLTLSASMIKEALKHAMGIGSVGDIPGWATSLDGEDFVTLRLEDFALLFEEQVSYIPQRQSDARRERAKLPIAVRHAMEDEDESDD